MRMFVINVVNAMNFCKKCVDCVECGEKNNPSLFTAFLTKTHHEVHRISYKTFKHRHLWQINVRNAVNAVKKIHRYLTSGLSVIAKKGKIM